MAGNFCSGSASTVAQPIRSAPPPLQTSPEFIHDICIHELFEEQAASTPDSVALRCEGKQFTFDALNRRASDLALRLRAAGVGPETIVSLFVDRSLEMVAGMLGVLKAGGAFLPCDPTYPRERLAYMLADAQVPVILTTKKLVAELPEHRARVLHLDYESQSGGLPSARKLPNPATPDNPAYLIYTSGSTGRPKGVLGLHRGAVNRMQWIWRTHPYQPGEVCCQKAPFGFVDTVGEVFTPLLRGVPLVIVPDATVRDPVRLIETLSAENVTRITVVATLLRMMLHASSDIQAQLPRLKYWVSSGEELPRELQQSFFAARPGSELHNFYGSTESSIDVSHWQCERGRNGARVPIGRPLSNNFLYVLNSDLQAAPVDGEGELHIAGVGLARGYLNRPALTAEAFVPNPHGEQAGARLYRSGDLARLTAGGVIEYLGRADGQVKIRGHRIELGEIEAALYRHRHVREAVVVAKEHGSGGLKLVAYIVASETEVVSSAELRDHLRDRLPAAMVPASFVFLAALPRTPSGKTDRRALRAASSSPERTRVVVSPRTSEEFDLAAIWANLLHVANVGVDDDFFALGGDSLIATQAMAQVREHFGVNLPVTCLFENPTVAGLARHLGNIGRTGTQPTIGRAPAEALPTLSFAEQRLWFLDKLEETNPGYFLFSAWRLKGALQKDALERSLTRIAARHDVLRTTFPEVDDLPARQVASDQHIRPRLIDLEDIPRRERFSAALKRASEIVQLPFDLARGPLLRVALIKLGAEDHILLCTMHHIISDDWSMDILVSELGAFYNSPGREVPDLPIRYSDFAYWQRRRLTDDVVKAQLRYWRHQLSEVSQVLDLPSDRLRPTIRTFRGSHHRFAIAAELTAKLRNLGAESGATMFMVLLSGFFALLARYSGQTDFAIGTPSTTRSNPETETIIGLFVNTLVLRADLSGDPTGRQLLERVRSVVLEARENQHVPLDRVIEALQPERSLGLNPLFQVIFAWQRAAAATPDLCGLEATPVNIESGISIVDLSLTMQDAGDTVVGEFEYRSDLFDVDRIARMEGHYITLLEELAADPARKVSSLRLLTSAERRQFLSEWNHPVTTVRKRCLHHLFEEQADRTPDAIALAHGSRQLTYSALNARSNRLARHLRLRGIGPEVSVGLCMDRSLGMVAGLLGILKAGGVLVPLDPAYPEKRLAFMLEDADLSLVVADRRSSAHLPVPSSRVVLSDTFVGAPVVSADDSAVVEVSPENVAYVIYTSGSTAMPKGVMVEHQAIVDHCQNIQATYQVRHDDRILQFASLSFDPALEQIFCALLTGATLVLPSDTVLTTTEFQRQITEQAISVVNIPPDYWRQLAEELAGQPEADLSSSIRLVIVGGDVFPSEAIRFWQQTPHQAARLLNAYGPTEATITSTTFELASLSASSGESKRVPLGRPVGNRTLYVRDWYENLQPIGSRGELTIGGTSLARGYLKRPSLTAERFVPDPYGNQPGARLYRTGDIVSYLPDGNVEFHGRNDEQVKIRGFRVEPSEVESHLKGHPAVSDAVILKSQAKPLRQLADKELAGLARRAGSVDQEETQRLLTSIERLSDAEVELELAKTSETQGPPADEINRVHREFELSLRIKDEGFIRPPRTSQRNWILQRTLDEFADDIQHLDAISRRFVPSEERSELLGEWETSPAQLDNSQLIIGRQQVMQGWQRPLMKAMSDIVSESQGDVLEVGFGMGISASYIQERGVRSHSIVECNDDVIRSFKRWREALNRKQVTLVRGRWQDVVGELGVYDGILFDTYPTSEEEFHEYVVEHVTFAEPFFETAARCLKKGGVFTYYTNEVDSFSRRHQRLLFRHFSSISLSVVKSLSPPKNNVNWWADSMVVVRAVK